MTNSENIKNGIQEYLVDKYNEDFIVDELYFEFSGNIGGYIKAKCHSLSTSEDFYVYLYDSNERVDVQEQITIDKKYYIKDEYIAIKLQNDILKKFENKSFKNFFVRCVVEFEGKMPTTNDYKEGIEKCIGDEEYESWVRFYIISDGKVNKDELEMYRTEVENYINELSPFEGYIYYGVKSVFSEDVINRTFEENKYNFGNYLSNSDFINYLEFTSADRFEGLSERTN